MHQYSFMIISSIKAHAIIRTINNSLTIIVISSQSFIKPYYQYNIITKNTITRTLTLSNYSSIYYYFYILHHYKLMTIAVDPSTRNHWTLRHTSNNNNICVCSMMPLMDTSTQRSTHSLVCPKKEITHRQDDASFFMMSSMPISPKHDYCYDVKSQNQAHQKVSSSSLTKPDLVSNKQNIYIQRQWWFWKQQHTHIIIMIKSSWLLFCVYYKIIDQMKKMWEQKNAAAAL